jgi:hypothetical protein
MSVEIIGPRPFETDAEGRLKSRVATVFPRHRVLVTLPGIHAWQRMQFLEWLNAERSQANQPPLKPEEEAAVCAHSVDLFIEPALFLIRPDPHHMELAFEADRVLQELVSKFTVRFLFVWNDKVQQAIKERGECWRISALPQSRGEMQKLIQDSKVPIGGRCIYYYNRVTGTRHLTYQEFAGLRDLDPPALAAHLQEIAVHSVHRNRLGNPEVDFFAAAPSFGAPDLAGIAFTTLSPADLARKYDALQERFHAAVEPACRRDDFRDETWRNRLYSALVGNQEGMLAEEVLRGLSPEFFLAIEWLPGGHFEDGEFMFDDIFDEAARHPEDQRLAQLCDETAKGFVFNFIREYGDLEYINLGRIPTSLSTRRPLPGRGGRRGVYIAELQLRGARERLVRFIRLQKWGVRERLDEGKDLLRAIIESEQYTDYILDRRLGCRQLGMNLVRRVTMRRLSERYTGPHPEFQGQMIWAPYFERDYTHGIATDKPPRTNTPTPPTPSNSRRSWAKRRPPTSSPDAPTATMARWSLTTATRSSSRTPRACRKVWS